MSKPRVQAVVTASCYHIDLTFVMLSIITRLRRRYDVGAFFKICAYYVALELGGEVWIC